MSKIKTKLKVKGNVYEAELEECKKQIEISLDYFNSSKKHHKRNAIKPNSLSAKYKSNNTRSRNLKKNGLFTKSTGKSDYHLNTNNTRKNSKVYMKLTGGKPKKVGPDNKENNSKNANKNPLRLNRKSYGGKVALQSNLSSTGAYNSITKQSEVSSGSNSYAPSRKQKNYSTRDKPIYQISETGGSVQNFSKLSPTLRKSSDTSGVSPILSGDSQSKLSREDPTRN